MTVISATIRLRPTRIGFLVRPTDMASIRKIMRACACLWGGIYNPIIPVFRVPPKEWRAERFDRVRGFAVARGYINFFEPDVFVEAEDGLLEEAGLGALRERYTLREHVLPLKNFLIPSGHRDWSEPQFGLNIVDVFRHLYETEHRFQLRDKRPSVFVKPERSNGLVEAIFGTYPRQSDATYISTGYKNVFAPEELEASPKSWLEVFRQGAQTPLGVTQHEIDTERFWHHDLLIYVFDPARPTDLIDLWNLRLEPRPVLPVPINWFEGLANHIREFIEAEHRPVRGNPSGIMHEGTVEFGRSIGKNRADELTKALGKDLPTSAFSVKNWRTPVWVEHKDDRIQRDKRLGVTAEEQRTSLTVEEGRELTASFEALAPKFASDFGGNLCRWVNAIRVSMFGREKIATVLPFNMFDRRWPRLAMGGEWVTVGSEGWILSQESKNWSETLSLLTKEDAIIGSLKVLGIEASLSDPGHIAKQMLDHLGGLWGVHLLADLETLKLLNKMAGGVRRKTNQAETIEETFERRSAPVKSWTDLLARRKQQRPLPRLELADFTRSNIIRLGLETDCAHCHFTNWHSLTAVDYEVTCERCLNRYDFPQDHLREQNRNWFYRVVGPFSVPDYGRGSYSALLTLHALQSSLNSRDEMTFSTSLNLKFDGVDAEVDFAAWRREGSFDTHNPPDLVVGETKSLGDGVLIKQKDLNQLKTIGRKLPGAIIVISVLRPKFLRSEKKLLEPFVLWGRRTDDHGQPTNPVILLTGNELFAEHQISATWEKLGEPYNKFSSYENTKNIRNLADATQQIYLGLPSFHEWQHQKWQKRAARKKKT